MMMNEREVLRAIQRSLEQLVELKQEELAILRARTDTSPVVNLRKWYGAPKVVSDDDKAYVMPDGTKHWIDDRGRFHRCGGPAIIFPNGTEMWYHHGRQHREGAPAVVHADGSVEYWVDGVKQPGPPEVAP